MGPARAKPAGDKKGDRRHQGRGKGKGDKKPAAPLHTDQERKDNGVCWPFQKGHCRFGDDCRFEHSSEAGTKPRRVAMVNMALAGEAEAYTAQIEAMRAHIDQMESRMLALGIEPQEQSAQRPCDRLCCDYECRQ